MVLAAQSLSTHNRVVGRRIPHPASTNFTSDIASPLAKRLKKNDSLETTLSRSSSIDEKDATRSYSPSKSMAREVKDSQEEGDSEQDALPPGSQTDLESALPPVNTDKQAIEEYETMGPQNRLKFRKWTKGKTSIYVDAFNLALDTVLEEEGDLFDEAELAVFDNWRNSSYEAQYLYGSLKVYRKACLLGY